MQEKYLPIQSYISFADASLQSFDLNEDVGVLYIYIESWDDQIVKISFKNVLYVEYKPGDFISDIYYVASEPQIVNEALTRRFIKIPPNHSYKLISIIDIDDHPTIKVVCDGFSISKGLTIDTLKPIPNC